MPNLDITLFGPPRAERDGIPVTFHRHQTLALLAYLAATDGRMAATPRRVLLAGAG